MAVVLATEELALRLASQSLPERLVSGVLADALEGTYDVLHAVKAAQAADVLA